MDRKKIIVTAVVINAGLLTALFIAALTLQDAPTQSSETMQTTTAFKEVQPLFKEIVEIPKTPPILTTALPNQPLPFSLPPLEEQIKISDGKTTEVLKLKNSPASPIRDGTEYYTMKVGDNPWSIAMKHHMKVEELLKLNGLNDKTARKLKPGDRLKIK